MRENMVKISVIMPVYNGANFLNNTIHSVMGQSLKDVEVICVDDGSTDNSVEILENLNKKFQKIKIIKQQNQGSGKARNTGIENATGEYIAFLDADDIFINPRALEIMYNFAMDNDKANMVSANLEFIEKNYTFKANWHYHDGDYAYCDKYGFISPKDYGIPFAFYKNIFNRQFLIDNNIKFPDLIRGQDPVFLAEVLAATKKVYTVPLYLYGYNYSIGGGVNIKVNTYEKKFSYMKHFKVACEVLEKGNLIKCCEDYKVHILNYLTWRDNIYDVELYDIYSKIYADIPNYFNESDEKFIKFNIMFSSYNLVNSNDENYFNEVKNQLANVKYSQDDDITKQLNLVKNSNSLEEFKSNYNANPIAQWKTIENKVEEKPPAEVKTPKIEATPEVKETASPIELSDDELTANRQLISMNREIIAKNRELIANNPENKELIVKNKELIAKNKELLKRNKELLS